VANVLLYDRLIIPVMSAQADRNERAYWLNKKWDPDLQAKLPEAVARSTGPRSKRQSQIRSNVFLKDVICPFASIV